jgi:hypothetical protein
LRCSALRNANCLRVLARVERRASLRVSILAEHLKGTQNVHGASKIDFYEAVNVDALRLPLEPR